MKKYRLYDSKEARQLITDVKWVAVVILLPIPFMFFFVPKITDMLIFTALWVVVLGSLLLGIFLANYNHYGKTATLDGGVLKLYAPRGREIAEYHLDDMNKAYVVFDHAIRGGLRHKCLLLCQKGLVLEGEYTQWGEEWLPLVKLYEYSRADKKKMVDVENKELEEKILAYYGEPITEPDTTV